MATPYRYTGTDARDYPTLGFSVQPGDILYLDGRAPDDRFVAVVDGDVPADTRTAAGVPDEAPARPNKAAPAADWTAYAKADGGFQEATGVHPDDATRKAIVDHYTAEQPAEQAPADGAEQAPTSPAPAEQPDAPTEA